MENIDRSKYQIVSNPERYRGEFSLVEKVENVEEIYANKEQAQAMLKAGIIDSNEISTTVIYYRKFKSIGFCKDRCLAKFIEADVAGVNLSSW